MLKFPSGCAEATGALASWAATQRASATTPTSARRIGTSRRPRRSLAQLGERPLGHVGVQHVEARVDREAPREILARLVDLAETVVDHPGVKVQARVARA